MNKQIPHIIIAILTSILAVTFLCAATASRFFLMTIVPILESSCPYVLTSLISISIFATSKGNKFMRSLLLGFGAAVGGYLFWICPIVLYYNAASSEGFTPVFEYPWLKLFKNLFLGEQFLQHAPHMLITFVCVMAICLFGSCVAERLKSPFIRIVVEIMAIICKMAFSIKEHLRDQINRGTNIYVLKVSKEMFDFLKTKKRTLECFVESTKILDINPDDNLVIISDAESGEKIVCRMISVNRYNNSDMNLKYGVFSIEWEIYLYVEYRPNV